MRFGSWNQLWTDRVPLSGTSLSRQRINQFLEGDFYLEKRMRLKIESPIVANSLYALNEVVVEKIDPGRTVRLALEINGISSLRMQPMG